MFINPIKLLQKMNEDNVCAHARVCVWVVHCITMQLVGVVLVEWSERARERAREGDSISMCTYSSKLHLFPLCFNCVWRQHAQIEFD